MPQSSVRSYFKELSSGNWELQIPEDPASRASHRWPIGFVTTGFVRGRLVYIILLHFPRLCVLITLFYSAHKSLE